MPYITKKREMELWGEVVGGDDNKNCAGDLNYWITDVIMRYTEHKGLSYQTLNDVSGALTECLAEYRRRVIAPYEIKKAKINQDVYKPMLKLLRKVK